MSSFDITVLTAQPKLLFEEEERRVIETVLPVILPLGPEQAVPIGLIRFNLNKDVAEAYFSAGLAKVEEMVAPPKIEVATNLQDVEQAAKGLDDLRGNDG